MKGCGLSRIPSAITFDRRLATQSHDIKNRATVTCELFVKLFARDKIVDQYVLSRDSTLIKPKGSVLHKSSIKKKVVSRSGIDIDARCGFSFTKD